MCHTKVYTMSYPLPYLIVNRNKTFYLRFMIPLFSENGKRGRREIRFSLRTKDSHEALSLYQLVLPTILSKIKEVTNMTLEQINVEAQMEDIKASINELINTRIEVLRMNAAKNNSHWKTELAKRQLKETLIDNFMAPITDLITENTKNLSLSNNFKSDSDHYKMLSEGLLMALKKGGSSASSLSTSDNQPLCELLSKYLAERKPSLSQRTFVQLEKTLERFIEIIGIELKSQELSNLELDRYCYVTKNIKSNFGKNKDSKPTDPKELVEYWLKAAKDNTEKKLASGGLEKHFSSVRPFLGWCSDRHNTSTNHSSFPGLRKPKNVKDSVERTPFSEEQLNSIFKSYIYTDYLRRGERPKAYQFWLPLIALTTGMRIAEIVGLEKEDIKQEEGIWIFDVNGTWHSSSRQHSEYVKDKKNKSSCRKIPISQRLISFGFLDYVERLRKHDVLFPELTLGSKKGLGDYASKWFNGRFMGYINLVKQTADGSQRVSFHSFRHGFVTNLDRTDINGNTLNDSERHYITGHEQEGVRNKTYNHSGVSLQRLKEYVDAMDHKVDLTNISYKRFSRRTQPKN
jgi:integrase